MNTINIAIDGPSGAGKSTLARMTAARLGYIYVDTGALYRSIGLYALRTGVDTKSESEVTPLLSDITLDMKHDDDGLQCMFLNGENVTDKIRLPEVSSAASNVSAIPSVRSFLLDTQREIAKKNNVIMDGRDIGTVVLPDAQVKIFLTASSEERALRRFRELCERGVDTDYKTVLSDIITRDNNDSSREIAPLKAADDAVLVDTTGLTLDESFEAIKRVIEERTANG